MMKMDEDKWVRLAKEREGFQRNKHSSSFFISLP